MPTAKNMQAFLATLFPGSQDQSSSGTYRLVKKGKAKPAIYPLAKREEK